MAVNEPVKQRSSTGADTLVGHLHDSAEYLANRGFRVPSGHLEIERQALEICKPFRQFLREVLFSGLWVKVGHVKKTVSNRCEVTFGSLLESIALESIIKMRLFESKRCVWRCDTLHQSPERSGIVSRALEALRTPDQIVAQVLEEKLDGHLEEMAEEERITEIRELKAFLPATELGGGFVPEEGRELLARHASFRA